MVTKGDIERKEEEDEQVMCVKTRQDKTRQDKIRQRSSLGANKKLKGERERERERGFQ